MHTLTHHIFQTQLNRIHMQNLSHLIDDGFQRKNTLGCAVTAICTGCQRIRIYDIKHMAKSFHIGGIHRHGFVTGQSGCGRTMVAIGSCIGQIIQIKRQKAAILRCTDFNFYFHFMTGRTGNLAFIATVDQFGRFFRFPCHKGRINFCYNGLFCTKPATNPGFHRTDLAFRNAQCIGQDPADMVDDLCGA